MSKKRKRKKKKPGPPKKRNPFALLAMMNPAAGYRESRSKNKRYECRKPISDDEMRGE